MVEVMVAIKAAREAVEVMRSLAVGNERRQQRAADVHEAKRLLGLVDPAGEAYRSDAVHPLYVPGHIHPDNEAALKAVASDALARKVSIRDELAVDASDRSLLLFGSPTSEGLSRIVFGYREVEEVEGLVWRDPPVDLAYTWELDPSRVEDRRGIGRYVPGKGIVERPTWQINDLRRSSHLRPQADAERLLASDYLLVTRMPNFLSSDALETGQFLVSFGGAHGTGTRAVELLLRDRRLLTAVMERLKSKHAQNTDREGGAPDAYQLLFNVSRIRHGSKGSVARSIELVDAALLPDNDQAWDEARRKVAPRLEAWQRERGDAAPES